MKCQQHCRHCELIACSLRKCFLCLACRLWSMEDVFLSSPRITIANSLRLGHSCCWHWHEKHRHEHRFRQRSSKKSEKTEKLVLGEWFQGENWSFFFERSFLAICLILKLGTKKCQSVRYWNLTSEVVKMFFMLISRPLLSTELFVFWGVCTVNSFRYIDCTEPGPMEALSRQLWGLPYDHLRLIKDGFTLPFIFNSLFGCQRHLWTYVAPTANKMLLLSILQLMLPLWFMAHSKIIHI